MCQTQLTWKNLGSIAGITIVVFLAFVVVTAEQEPEQGVSDNNGKTKEYASGYLWENGKMIYRHVWPEMKFSWQIVLGTIIAFFGAALGSVGGVGGGGIFVPMLTLIIGFDPKSSTAVSKCMITGAAGASVYYNLRLRHPTLDLPIIDYDLALLFQPMLVLGISIGVAFNVIFADWMVTVLLIILFIGTSTKAFFKGVETWKKETTMKQEAAKILASSGTSGEPGPYKVLPGGPSCSITIRQNVNEKSGVSIIANICWKELCILIGVWSVILFLQITKENGTRTCSMAYWILNLLQVSSATATFAMTFSSSMSVVQYYLLKRFPVPYAIYFFTVATVASLVGQHVVRKIVGVLGRASLIIFILAFTIFVSTISLGGVGIPNIIGKIAGKEYMGFDDICAYDF